MVWGNNLVGNNFTFTTIVFFQNFLLQLANVFFYCFLMGNLQQKLVFFPNLG